MPQNNEVMAFRKRLKGYGYTEIKIVQARDEKGESLAGWYDVEAVEPLGKMQVGVRLSVGSMPFMFK